jgi:flagellar biosynthesis/type III secretory pathway protein FliH
MFPSFDADDVATAPALWGERGGARLGVADAEMLRAQARAQGCEEGRAAGRAAAYAEWNARLGALASGLEQMGRALAARRLELAAEVDRRLPALALLLGEKIVRQELGSSTTAAQTVIRGVSERLAGGGRAVAVRIAPQLCEAFETWRASAGAEAAPATLRVEADATLGAGEWLLETDDGFLDGRIESQIESAWRTVSELLG